MELDSPSREVDLDAFAAARNCLRLVLGRDALTSDEILRLSRYSTTEILRNLVNDREFRTEVEAPLVLRGAVAGSRFLGDPSRSFIDWLAQSGSTGSSVTQAVAASTGWRSVLTAIWADPQFRNVVDPEGQSRARFDAIATSLATATDERWSSRAGGAAPTHVSDERAFLIALPDEPVQPSATFDIDLMPRIRRVHHLVRLRGRFATSGQDPQILLGPLEPGRYRFVAELAFTLHRTGAAGDYAQLFVDFGDGCSEGRSLRFPLHERAVVLNACFEVREPLRELRLDPCVKPALFQIGRFGLNRL
ncbi:MAG: hypothetical protein INR70_29275 [Parafilimonas terrae]|nr:hypothetical protein [Parafilimonas terrae]